MTNEQAIATLNLLKLISEKIREEDFVEAIDVAVGALKEQAKREDDGK